VDNLQRETDQKEISLNVLVNQVLRRYVKWDTFEPKLGMMPVPKIILSTCFNRAILVANNAGMNQDEIDSHRDEIIESAAEISFSLIKDSALLMKRTYNLWTVLEILQEYKALRQGQKFYYYQATTLYLTTPPRRPVQLALNSLVLLVTKDVVATRLQPAQDL
jgi:hypothetical protein